MERTIASPNEVTIICTPKGIFSLVEPIGMLIEGRPVLLNTIVFCNKAWRVSTTTLLSTLTTLSLILGGSYNRRRNYKGINPLI